MYIILLCYFKKNENDIKTLRENMNTSQIIQINIHA